MATVKVQHASFELAEKDLKQVGHEQDYSWITGKLFHAPGAPGRWVLRYTGPYEEDRYGGAVLLGSAAELANFHEGDLICVHGKMVGNSSSARSGAGAGYEVHTVNLIERASH
jgi:hypothetical protein